MIGMVLVTHGRLAAEFVAALEHVVGPQTHIRAVCIGAERRSSTAWPRSTTATASCC